MQKLLDENNPSNTVVRVIVRAEDNQEYECIGVLLKEEENSIRIVFTAKDDQVVDFLDIKRSDIVSIEVIDVSKIEKL